MDALKRHFRKIIVAASIISGTLVVALLVAMMAAWWYVRAHREEILSRIADVTGFDVKVDDIDLEPIPGIFRIGLDGVQLVDRADPRQALWIASASIGIAPAATWRAGHPVVSALAVNDMRIVIRQDATGRYRVHGLGRLLDGPSTPSSSSPSVDVMGLLDTWITRRASFSLNRAQVTVLPHRANPIELTDVNVDVRRRVDRARRVNRFLIETTMASPELVAEATVTLDPDAGGVAIEVSGIKGTADTMRSFFLPPLDKNYVVQWLGENIPRGRVRSGSARLFVPSVMPEIPTMTALRLFVDADIEDAEVRFLPGWPTVSARRVGLRISDDDLDIKVTGARSLGVRANSGTVSIHAMDTWDTWLVVKTGLEGAYDDARRWVGASGLSALISPYLDRVGAQGHLGADLMVRVPLWGATQSTVTTNLVYAGSRVGWAGEGGGLYPDLALDNVTAECALEWRGGASTDLFTVDASLTARAMLGGTPKMVSELLLDTDDSVPVSASVRLDPTWTLSVDADLEKVARARYVWDTRSLDPRAMSLYLGRAGSTPVTNLGTVTADIPRLAGALIMSPGQSPWRLDVRSLSLDPFGLSKDPKATNVSDSVSNVNAPITTWIPEVPHVAFRCVSCSIGATELRHVTADIEPRADGVTIRRVGFRGAHTGLHDGRVDWTRVGQSARTNARASFAMRDLGGAIESFGVKSPLSGGRGDVDFKASWEGAPWDAMTRGVAGISATVEGDLREARVERSESIVMTLLNLVTLNFVSAYSRELRLESARGRLSLDGGKLSTRDLRLDFSPFVVALKGGLGIVSRTIDSDVALTLRLGRVVGAVSMAMLSPATAAIWSVSDVPIDLSVLDSLSRQFYQVSGSWEEPSVVMRKFSRIPIPRW